MKINKALQNKDLALQNKFCAAKKKRGNKINLTLQNKFYDAKYV